MASPSISISSNLEFYVSWLFYQFFHVHSTIPESRQSLLNSRIPAFSKLFFAPDGTHSLTTTTSGSFYHYRIADFFSNFLSFFQRFYKSIRPWNTRNSSRFHCCFCSGFVTHFFYLLWRSSYEFYSIFLTNSRKISIFSQKSITRVNGICICNFCCCNDVRNFQIRILTRRRTYTYRFIRKSYMQTVFIRD